jgi:hypothetical protein
MLKNFFRSIAASAVLLVSAYSAFPRSLGQTEMLAMYGGGGGYPKDCHGLREISPVCPSEENRVCTSTYKECNPEGELKGICVPEVLVLPPSGCWQIYGCVDTPDQRCMPPFPG